MEKKKHIAIEQMVWNVLLELQFTKYWKKFCY